LCADSGGTAKARSTLDEETGLQRELINQQWVIFG